MSYIKLEADKAQAILNYLDSHEIHGHSLQQIRVLADYLLTADILAAEEEAPPEAD